MRPERAPAAKLRPEPRPRDEDADLAFHLDHLDDLLDDTVSLQATLNRLAEYTTLTFRAVAGAVVSMANRSGRAIAGVEPIRLADDLQAMLREGPSLDALARRVVTSCGSLGGSTAWRRFGPRAGRLGLHSVLALPLVLPDTDVAVLTVYSGERDAFTPRDIEVARYYAPTTAALVRNAYLLEQSRRRVAELTEALRVRPEIDRAVGVIMSRTGKSAEQALKDLRRMSNNRHIKVSDLATEMVDHATKKAQRRHRTGPELHVFPRDCA